MIFVSNIRISFCKCDCCVWINFGKIHILLSQTFKLCEPSLGGSLREKKIVLRDYFLHPNPQWWLTWLESLEQQNMIFGQFIHIQHLWNDFYIWKKKALRTIATQIYVRMYLISLLLNAFPLSLLFYHIRFNFRKPTILFLELGLWP